MDMQSGDIMREEREKSLMKQHYSLVKFLMLAIGIGSMLIHEPGCCLEGLTVRSRELLFKGRFLSPLF